MDWGADLPEPKVCADARGAHCIAAEGAGDGAPVEDLAADENFDVVLGSDLLYEEEQAPALAAVLARRLAPRGLYISTGPVRTGAVFARFFAELVKLGFAVRIRSEMKK